MNLEERKYPITLMIDAARHQQLKAMHEATTASMSELFRVAVSLLSREMGDLTEPAAAVLADVERERLSDRRLRSLPTRLRT